MKKPITFTMVMAVLCSVNNLFAQAPSLNYTTNTYTLYLNYAANIPGPNNTGGAVPATVYGTVTRFAGRTDGASGVTDGATNGTTARFSGPAGLDITSNGTMFIADKTNNRIRRILSGTASTPAGSSTGYIEGTTTAARFAAVQDITDDGAGNYYIADFTNNRIRKMTMSGSSGTTTFLAGQTNPGTTDGTGSAARFNGPASIVYDPTTAALFVVEQTNGRIRKVTTAGVVTTLVSSGLSSPTGIATDGAGNFYVADKGNNRIKKVTAAGVVTTFAGSGTASSVDGTGTAATFNAPSGVAVDPSGNVYVTEATGNKVRRITPAGVVTTIAGSGVAGRADGLGTAATFNAPADININPSNGYLYVADFANNQIRQIIATGYSITPALPAGLTFNSSTGAITGTPTTATAPTVYTITGFNASGSSSVQITIETDYTLPAISYTTPVSYPVSTAITSPTFTNTGSPVISTFGYENTPTQPFTGGVLNGPAAAAVDADGNVYIANYTSNTISKFSSAGTLITNSYGSGAPALVNPRGIVFDSNGNMYVLNGTSGYMYKYDANGNYLTSFSISPGATLLGLCIDASDNMYVAGYAGSTNGVIRVTTTGTITYPYLTNASNMSAPVDIGVDAAGALYVLNNTTGRVYKYASTGVAGTLFATVTAGSFGLNVDAVNGYVYVSDLNSTSPSPKILVYTTAGVLSATITGVNSCYGICTDGKGSIIAPDFINNLVYKYSPTGTFFLNKTLPSGLTLNKTTGAISGTTAATSSPATDYIVTGWNSAGGSSATINITVYQTKTWTSTTSTNWATAGNWSGGVPGPGDKIIIGQTNGLTVPTITAAGTTKISSISFVNTGSTAPSISVASGSTLEVTGDITFTNTKASNLTANITGAGTVNATNLTVTNSFSAASYSLTFNSSISNLNLSGDLTLNSNNPTSTTRYLDANFTLSGTSNLTVKNIKTVNANANNTPVITLGNNTTLNFTGASPLAGLSATGTNTITIGTGTTIGYMGENDQTVYTNLAIPNSSLNSGISYANIAFGGSGIKTPAGDATNNLNVSGNFTNSLTSNATDTYVDLSNTKLNLNGTTQALAAGAGLGTTLYNTTVSGGGTKTMSGTGSGVFKLATTGVLTLSGSSTLASGDVLTLASDSTSSATIATIPVGSKITGKVVAQRFVTGRGNLLYRGYRLFSSPVSDMASAGAAPYPYYNLSYLTSALGSNTFTTGAAGGGFDATGNPTMYLYREDKSPSTASFNEGNYRAITKIDSTAKYAIRTVDGAFNLPAGTGIMFFNRGNNTTNPSNPPLDNVLKPSGYLNQGQIVVKNWVTNTAGLSYNSANVGDPRYDIQGFNLVGNPYPSSIDWHKAFAGTASSGIYAPNTDQTIYIYNATTKNYDSYLNTSAIDGIGQNGMTNIIPQGQGFFVRATAANAELIFNEDAKVTNEPDILLLNAAAPRKNPTLRLQLSKDNINKDETVIVFDNTKSAAYVKGEDAPYLKGSGVVSLSNMSSNKVALAISQQPFLLPSQYISLNVRVSTAGTYQLKLKEITNIPTVYDIWLKDNFKNDSLDLKNNAVYSFNTTSDTASYGANRFKIVMRVNNNAPRLLSFTGVKDDKKVKLNWTAENEGNHTTYILQRSTDGGATYQVLDSLTSMSLGTYEDIDTSPATGENKYRLKQVDVLGNITYANIVTINFTIPGTPPTGTVLVYPNPVRYVLAVGIKPLNNKPATYNITVTNNMGIVIKKATTNLKIWLQEVSSLLPGTYFVTVTNKADETLVGRTSFIKL